MWLCAICSLIKSPISITIMTSDVPSGILFFLPAPRRARFDLFVLIDCTLTFSHW